jgi:tetratricopeptide (TPR) repeat protein
MIAHDRNPVFTAREEILQCLAESFTGSGTAASRQAIVGLGGVGKTQIAVEYAHRFRHKYSHIFWTHGYSSEALLSGFTAIATALNLVDASVDSSEIVSAVLAWFGAHGNWLLVVDNADDVKVLQSFLPSLCGGHILVTSRSRNTQDVGILHPIEVPELTVNEASKFLLRRIGRSVFDIQEEESLQKLAEVLGGLPLALEQAGAYMMAKQTRIDTYLSAYLKMEVGLLERHRPSLGNYSKSVATTWALNFAEVDKCQSAGDLLRISAFLAPDQIPLNRLANGDIELAELSDFVPFEFGTEELSLDEVLAELSRYSLIRRRPASYSYNIHRLVQSVLRSEMTKDERQKWCCRALEVLVLAFPRPQSNQELEGAHREWAAFEALVPHALTACDRAEETGVTSFAAAMLLNASATYLRERGGLQESAHRFEQAVCLFLAAKVPEDPWTATLLNNLGHVYELLGFYDLAKPILEEALHMRVRLFGSNSLEVANSMNNLGTLFNTTGESAKAAYYYETALLIRETLLGPDDLDVATSLNNVASLALTDNGADQAEAMLKRAYMIRRDKLGAGHPQTAQVLCNLAISHSELGRLSEAETELFEALQASESELGSDHIQVAKVLDRLARNYAMQGRLDNSVPVLSRAMEIHERVLGMTHFTTISICLRLASALLTLDRLGESESLLRTTLARLRASTESDHGYMAEVLYQLGNVRAAQGERNLARQDFAEALSEGEQVFGADDSRMDEIRKALMNL